jgi:low affinity Fe/Cu permease
VSPAQWTTAVGSLTGHPAAFVIVVLYGIFWFLSEPSTFDWHAIATLIVWTMTLFIQRADRRDTLAIHAKLDELLKATHEAEQNWHRSTNENRRLSRKFVTASGVRSTLV